ncbi:MAG: DUF6624 domain-containing protein [Bacteroidota bacterium]
MQAKLAQKIVQLKDADLALRDKLIQRGELSNGYHPEMERLHLANAAALDEIISAIGYPTVDKVGQEASEAAWLIIQHAISRPAFMRKCRDLLEMAAAAGQASPLNLAYLSDRIAVYEGQPQRYGIQFDWDANGEMSPQPYDDLVLVNQRREALGLNTLEEQTAVMRARVEAEGEQAPVDHVKRQRAYNDWLRMVGWRGCPHSARQ